MMRLLRDHWAQRPVRVAIAVMLFGVSAFMVADWFSTPPPPPLTVEDERGVASAVQKISPGFEATNLRRDRDGKVRVFVWTPGQEGGQTIAVEKSDGRWIATVETLFF
jgi:hypothetical protein